MSVLGILAWLVFGGMSVADKIKNESETYDAREKAKQQGREIYYDSKMRSCLTSSGRQVYESTRDGDKVLLDSKTKQVIRNYTKEEVMEDWTPERRQKAIADKNNPNVPTYEEVSNRDKLSGTQIVTVDKATGKRISFKEVIDKNRDTYFKSIWEDNEWYGSWKTSDNCKVIPGVEYSYYNGGRSVRIDGCEGFWNNDPNAGYYDGVYYGFDKIDTGEKNIAYKGTCRNWGKSRKGKEFKPSTVCKREIYAYQEIENPCIVRYSEELWAEY